jgi:hypothetical protein
VQLNKGTSNNCDDVVVYDWKRHARPTNSLEMILKALKATVIDIIISFILILTQE